MGKKILVVGDEKKSVPVRCGCLEQAGFGVGYKFGEDAG